MLNRKTGNVCTQKKVIEQESERAINIWNMLHLLLKQGPEIPSRASQAISALKSEGTEPCEQGEGAYTARGRAGTVVSTWGAI